MELNDEVVATMYDRDYSGNNNRYAMFGQSVILDMKVLLGSHCESCNKYLYQGGGQVRSRPGQGLPGSLGWQESLHQFSRTPAD